MKLIVYNPPPPCVLVCPPTGTPEFEPCGDTWNDGCNMATPAYQDISYGETVCGEAFVTATARDTDWYKFTVPSNASITATTISEFQADIAIIDIREITLIKNDTSIYHTSITDTKCYGLFVSKLGYT